VRLIGARPHSEAILATAPRARAGMSASVDAQQLQQGQHHQAPLHAGFFRSDVLLFSLY
jgi:hypothetical protein